MSYRLGEPLYVIQAGWTSMSWTSLCHIGWVNLFVSYRLGEPLYVIQAGWTCKLVQKISPEILTGVLVNNLRSPKKWPRQAVRPKNTFWQQWQIQTGFHGFPFSVILTSPWPAIELLVGHPRPCWFSKEWASECVWLGKNGCCFLKILHASVRIIWNPLPQILHPPLDS
jgi:hypothetical protein